MSRKAGCRIPCTRSLGSKKRPCFESFCQTVQAFFLTSMTLCMIPDYICWKVQSGFVGLRLSCQRPTSNSNQQTTNRTSQVFHTNASIRKWQLSKSYKVSAPCKAISVRCKVGYSSVFRFAFIRKYKSADKSRCTTAPLVPFSKYTSFESTIEENDASTLDHKYNPKEVRRISSFASLSCFEVSTCQTIPSPAMNGLNCHLVLRM